MLTHIHIRDFAIVDELELDLTSGMSVLTGETGAGKSILLDALGLALGDRANADSVRHEADKAEITVQFELKDAEQARIWLQEQDLGTEEGECLIRRIITQDGKSRGYINGSPMPLQSLKTLGEMLVDIHGQHEHQSLLKRDIQRKLLDNYAGHEELVRETGQSFRVWNALQEEYETLRTAAEERNARLDLLRYQVQELENLDLGKDEVEQLDEEHGRLANAGKLLQSTQSVLQQLYEDEQESLLDRLGRLEAELSELASLDPVLESTRHMVNEAMIQLQEATQDLRHYSERFDLDPERLQWVDERLGKIHDLSRKHHILPEELPHLQEKLQQELDGLENADVRLESLQQEISIQYDRYMELARKLSRQRKKSASELDRQVSASIQQLGMPGARFEVQVENPDDARPTALGLDNIEFMVSTNPGQPLKPLRKIASGGELSRISLAIQTAMADNTDIPTLIYDEVDSGIGGPTAEIVGMQLRGLGQHRQVMCVTHLPQVASQAHHHLKVSKMTTRDKTHTQVTALDREQRIEEVARMLGGVEITDQSLSHAREMIDRGMNPSKPANRKKSRKQA